MSTAFSLDGNRALPLPAYDSPARPPVLGISVNDNAADADVGSIDGITMTIFICAMTALFAILVL